MNIPKFIAYIKKTSKISQVSSIDFDWKFVNVDGHDEETKECCNDIITRKYYFDEIELMQSTGKKDINDVEMYGGNIILFSPLCGEIHIKKKPGVILYDDATFFVRENYGSLTALQRLSREEIEIIGNIYQHKEKLEEL